MPFPTVVVDVLADELALATGAGKVMRRLLRDTDPDQSIGVIAADWVPQEMVIGQFDPAVATYLFSIQAFVKHAHEEEGRASHTNFAQTIRLMLYRNAGLRTRLAALSETADGMVERVQRWGVRQQRYASNEVEGQFLYLSTTEFWVETETV